MSPVIEVLIWTHILIVSVGERLPKNKASYVNIGHLADSWKTLWKNASFSDVSGDTLT
jgi:hypothetical protein